ncbi:protein E33A [Elephant endotheliotropic herpesvirus 5B]|nr:protein E33A [Elephant endotheliotropic herpesvirus 5B]
MKNMSGIKYQKTKSVNKSVDRSCMHTWLVILVSYLITMVLIDALWILYCMFAFGLFGPDQKFVPTREFITNQNVICR